jgi:hypothetical protein
MMVEVHGLAPSTGYDLFVIKLPNKPFGISWYQSDLETDVHGNGQATVRGIFNVETFSVPTGGPTTTFSPTHQYHLGLWFNDPTVPFNLGCEGTATSPIVTHSMVSRTPVFRYSIPAISRIMQVLSPM